MRYPGPAGSDEQETTFSSVPIEDIVADIMVPASTAVPANTAVPVNTAVPASVNVPGNSCPSCGARLPAEGPPGNGTVARAALPQPMAAALLATRALSPRERTVFQFLGLGYDNRSIARELGVSERTVKRHITLILAKLRLESRLQAGLTALILCSATNTGAARPGGRMDPGRTPAETSQ